VVVDRKDVLAPDCERAFVFPTAHVLFEQLEESRFFETFFDFESLAPFPE
jgi:hypothetical protein